MENFKIDFLFHKSAIIQLLSILLSLIIFIKNYNCFILKKLKIINLISNILKYQKSVYFNLKILMELDF